MVRDKIKSRGFFLILIILLLILAITFIPLGNYVKLVGNVISNIVQDNNCSEWGECQYNYNLDYLEEDVYLTGNQNRTCLINDMKETETRECISKEPIKTKKTDKYLEIYANDRLVEKLELIEEEDKLNIEIKI